MEIFHGVSLLIILANVQVKRQAKSYIFCKKIRFTPVTTASCHVFLKHMRQNELDAARAGGQNDTSMKFSRYFHKRHNYAAILGIAGLLGLSSCGEKEAEVPAEAPTEAPAPAPSPEPEVDKLAETREALFNHAVYVLGQKVSSPELFPELNSTVKDMLEMMQAYYTELQKGAPSEERARLALQIAGTTRDLGAYSKAQGEYEAAQKEIESLPEDVRNTPAVQRMLSSSQNGIGLCLLNQNKTADALLRYEAATAIDESLYQAVAPKEGEELPPGDVDPVLSRAAADLLDSYRCLGDCQRAADDPEEARGTYVKGQELGQRLKRLSSEMSIAYVKLLTSLGNLDNSMNKPQEAMGAWVMAARICQSLNASSPKLEIKAETKRCYDALVPAINAVAQKLQAEQQANEQKAAEEKAAAEKAAAEAAAAEKAAAERLAAEQAAQKAAEEQAAAEQAAQKQAEQRVRNRRRHR